jgi:hypothetical protein
VSSATRSTGASDSPGGDRTAVELGVVCLAVVAVAVLLGATYWASFLVPVVPGALVVYGPLVIGAVGYALVRGVDVDVEPPAADDLAVAALVVAGPALAVLAVAVAGARVGVPLDSLTGESYPPRAGIELVVSRRTLPAVATGVGYAAVLVAIVHVPVRRVVARPTAAVSITAGVLVVFHVLLVDAATQWVGFGVPPTRMVLHLSLAAGFVCLGVTAGFARQAIADRSIAPLYRPAFVPVYALGVVVAVGSLLVLAAVPDVVEHALWGLGFAAAAAGYERTRSVWVPAATLVVFDWTLGAASWGFPA